MAIYKKTTPLSLKMITMGLFILTLISPITNVNSVQTNQNQYTIAVIDTEKHRFTPKTQRYVVQFNDVNPKENNVNGKRGAIQFLKPDQGDSNRNGLIDVVYQALFGAEPVDKKTKFSSIYPDIVRVLYDSVSSEQSLDLLRGKNVSIPILAIPCCQIQTIQKEPSAQTTSTNHSHNHHSFIAQFTSVAVGDDIGHTSVELKVGITTEEAQPYPLLQMTTLDQQAPLKLNVYPGKALRTASDNFYRSILRRKGESFDCPSYTEKQRGEHFDETAVSTSALQPAHNRASSVKSVGHLRLR